MKSDTLLLRQINSDWWVGGKVTSLAFNPSKAHGHKLSVYDGEKISAEESWHHFTQKFCGESIGVMAVTVEECRKHCRRVVPDPKEFPEHVLIDFSDVSGNKARKLAKRLASYANERDWQFGPTF